MTHNRNVERIANFTIAFRIEFATHSIEKVKCDTIGTSEDYTINMHILNIDCKLLLAAV